MSAKAFEKITGRCVWTADEMRNDQSWVWPIPPQGLADIEAAIANVARRGLAPPAITAEDFALPSITGALADLSEELEEGRGFLVVRGLPVERYDEAQLRAILWGIGLHFGRPVQQTKHGEWFIDVRDEGGAHDQNMRGYHSPAALPFHSDGGNDVVLLCVNKARSGGLSSLVSGAAVHNALLASHPEFMESLYEGFPHDRRGAEPEGEPRISPWKLPVFSVTNGRFNCVFDRKSSEWGRQRLGQPLTPAEVATLDALDALTFDPQYRLDMDLQPGDLQFVNNFAVLHSRTAFVDDGPEEKRRHLIRLWLEAPQSHRRALNKLHLYTKTPLPQGLVPVKSVA